MTDLRAAKSGFAREAQAKMDAKFDQVGAQQCMEWIKKITGEEGMDTSGGKDSIIKELKDGLILNKLKKKIEDPTADVSKKENPKMTFVWIERLAGFNKFIKEKLDVPEHSTFTPENLIEGTNVPQVITCLRSVAMKCMKMPGVGGFGPKEAEANVRNFSEEQLAQGKSVIGLQMGTNKGASQAGQNFGKTRMITD